MKNQKPFVVQLLCFWRSYMALLAILLVCVIRLPQPDREIPVAHADKWVHLLLYMGLSSLLWLDQQRAQLQGWPKIIVLWLLPIAWGGLIELLQGTLFARSAEWMDMVANMVGVALGALLFRVAAVFFGRER